MTSFKEEIISPEHQKLLGWAHAQSIIRYYNLTPFTIQTVNNVGRFANQTVIFGDLPRAIFHYLKQPGSKKLLIGNSLVAKIGV